MTDRPEREPDAPSDEPDGESEDDPRRIWRPGQSPVVPEPRGYKRPKAKGLNRRDLAKAVAVHADVDLSTVSKVLEGFTDVVAAVVSRGEPVSISGFAKFVKVDRPARMGRNPSTGEQIWIKASKTARITPVKAFKDAVLNPASAPKLKRGSFPILDDLVKAAGKSVAPAPARRAAAGRVPAKKTTARKAPARKTAARKAPAKKVARQSSAKRRR